jgi:hypothetical protein
MSPWCLSIGLAFCWVFGNGGDTSKKYDKAAMYQSECIKQGGKVQLDDKSERGWVCDLQKEEQHKFK